MGSYLETEFDVLRKDDKEILVYFGPNALYCEYILWSGSRKQSEKIDQAHNVCLTCKLLRPSRGYEDLYFGFTLKIKTRAEECTANKQNHGKKHVRIFLKDIFGLAELQEKGTSGWGDELTLKTNIDNTMLSRNAATDDKKIDIKGISWYIPIYTPFLFHQDFLNKQIITIFPNEKSYNERSVCSKDTQEQTENFFEFGGSEVIVLHI